MAIKKRIISQIKESASKGAKAMVKTFDILLDLEKELYSPSSLLFSISRNDFNSVQLNFVITQDGTPIDLSNKTVELAVKKPSGLTVYQACEITSAQEGKAQA